MKQSIFLLFILLFGIVQAAQVKVGLYLLDVSKYDIKTGEFTADFYLDLQCNGACTQNDFEFMNGRATSSDLQIDTPNEKFYRIQGDFTSPVNLEKYPFDDQQLQIILENKLNTSDEITYVPWLNDSGIDPAITFPGWDIKGWNATVDNHFYVPYNQTYSRYTFTTDMDRIKLNAFLKTFFPLFFIVLITLASLYLAPSDMGFRLSIASTSLITTVLLHLALLSEIPPTPYLTFTDKFMFLTYIVILLSFLVNISLLVLAKKKLHADEEKLQSLTEKAVLLVPLVYILLFYLMLS